MASSVDSSLAEHLATLQLVRDRLQPEITAVAEQIATVLAVGGKLLICGNGGSAADAQHFAAELVGRFEKERRGLPALALTTDTSNLTAIGNDYGFAQIFSRQVAALATAGDLLIGLSTSGNSENVLQAITQAHRLGCATCSLTGRDGGQIAAASDLNINIPVQRTARVQEAHLTVLHIICELVEAGMDSSGA